MSEHILEKFSRIRLLAFDLDGVLTNGKLDIQPNGEWTRQMDIKDGFALQLAVIFMWLLFLAPFQSQSATV
jgi:3-deoxy-D-manno-octulosonate 8-phosphate phosphatase (KDO 8-P phosphatase)